MTALRFERASAEAGQAAFALVLRAAADMERRGIPQWDTRIYPTGADLAADAAAGTLYLGFLGNSLSSIFVLDTVDDPLFQNGRWRMPDARWAVLHRLCVDPARQGGGLGTATCLAAEDTARALGYSSLRLDVFSRNPAALRLYAALGYERTGEAERRAGLFYLMEKRL